MHDFGKSLVNDRHYRIFVVLSYKDFVRWALVSPACDAVMQAYISEPCSQSLFHGDCFMANGLYGVKKNLVRKTQQSEAISCTPSDPHQVLSTLLFRIKAQITFMPHQYRLPHSQ